MKIAFLPAVTLLAICITGCRVEPSAQGCQITGPKKRLPQNVKLVQLGMTLGEVEKLLGAADYSPVEGQYYFSTGGDCPLEDSGRTASCGLVAEFRDYGQGGEAELKETLQSCWWGAIGE
jgi:hypothetical protein